MQANTIHVAVAAIVNANNEVFISRRHLNSHQGGLWEFPGGKVEADENIQQALLRELQEETGIHITHSRPLIRVHHDYHDKSVLLDVWKIDQYSGEPHGREGQDVRWENVHSLNPDEFPAADVPIIRALQLPERYLITGAFDSLDDFVQRLSSAINNGIRLVQLRLKPDWLQTNAQLAEQIVHAAEAQCHKANVTLLLNVPDKISALSACKNIHADSSRLQQLEKRPECYLFSASCHTPEDLRKAEKLNADFAVLSPVQKTQSHPDAEPLGWEKFQS
ncbi:MAG: Nudix family hydrolase, partial [Gammaproteobacteria bacterium]